MPRTATARTSSRRSAERFELLSAATRLSRSLSEIALPEFADGLPLAWQLEGIGNSLYLERISAGLEGDFNATGVVEQGDLDLVLLNWGAVGSTPPSRWTADLPVGAIDQGELDKVLLNWGRSASASPALGSGAASVPEARSIMLLLIALTGISVLLRRRS